MVGLHLHLAVVDVLDRVIEVAKLEPRCLAPVKSSIEIKRGVVIDAPSELTRMSFLMPMPPATSKAPDAERDVLIISRAGRVPDLYVVLRDLSKLGVADRVICDHANVAVWRRHYCQGLALRGRARLPTRRYWPR
jgi:hypothetical protein